MLKNYLIDMKKVTEGRIRKFLFISHTLLISSIVGLFYCTFYYPNVFLIILLTLFGFYRILLLVAHNSLKKKAYAANKSLSDYINEGHHLE